MIYEWLQNACYVLFVIVMFFMLVWNIFEGIMAYSNWKDEQKLRKGK